MMKLYLSAAVILVLILFSCDSVNVYSDFDKKTDFSNFKTYAFYKKGIDKVEISDLDKRRILKAIEADLLAKGFTKSLEPDLLVNIFTKSQRKVNVTSYYGGGYGYGGYGGYGGFYGGWYPWYYGPNYGTSVSEYTEGTLFVDLIDNNKKELAWQGIGSGALNYKGNVAKKEEKVKEFVTQIMAQYPPVIEQ